MSELQVGDKPIRPLYITLQRYALLGWGLFFGLTLFFMLYLVIDKLTPTPVIAVDESGRILGSIDYMDGTTRTDAQIIKGGKYFLSCYLSLTSDTIFEDYACALNMMSPELKASKLQEVEKTNYLARVDRTKTRSYLTFAENEGVSIEAKHDEKSVVRFKGKVMINAGAGTTESDFDITLYMSTIARTQNNMQGIRINAITDN